VLGESGRGSSAVIKFDVRQKVSNIAAKWQAIRKCQRESRLGAAQPSR
jgi:hypothetical protein